MSVEEFKQLAEDNLKSALNEIEKENKKLENRMILILGITAVLAICAIIKSFLPKCVEMNVQLV